MNATPSVRLVCVDIDGTLSSGIGGEPLAGAARALQRLRAQLAVRLVTNATSRTMKASGSKAKSVVPSRNGTHSCKATRP